MLIADVLELIVLSLPSGAYLAINRRDLVAARAVMGLQLSPAVGYLWATGILVLAVALTVVAGHVVLALLPHGATLASLSRPPSTGGHLHATIALPGLAGNSGNPAVLVSGVLLTTLAEEMLFRGFLAGLLIRRFGFPVGNSSQALLFLLPHLLLLLISRSIWPILAVQLVLGWSLGWLRHRYESILPGWTAHAATNLLLPLLIGLAVPL